MPQTFRQKTNTRPTTQYGPRHWGLESEAGTGSQLPTQHAKTGLESHFCPERRVRTRISSQLWLLCGAAETTPADPTTLHPQHCHEPCHCHYGGHYCHQRPKCEYSHDSHKRLEQPVRRLVTGGRTFGPTMSPPLGLNHLLPWPWPANDSPEHTAPARNVGVAPMQACPPA